MPGPLVPQPEDGQPYKLTLIPIEMFGFINPDPTRHYLAQCLHWVQPSDWAWRRIDDPEIRVYSQCSFCALAPDIDRTKYHSVLANQTNKKESDERQDVAGVQPEL